ncbi:hypothetical protein JQ591_32590 [Bradyrhizobium canariense]|nr:hypothetical protein [Bradyrhizobium canariense]
MGGQALDLVGAERVGEIARCDRLVLALADPSVRGLAVAALLELVEQIAETAAEHAAGCATREQAAKATLEQVTEAAASAKRASETATSTRIHRRGEVRRRRGLLRRRAGLACGHVLECLPGEQAEERHGHRRHAARGLLGAWRAGPARAVLHAVEDVE